MTMMLKSELDKIAVDAAGMMARIKAQTEQIKSRLTALEREKYGSTQDDLPEFYDERAQRR